MKGQYQIFKGSACYLLQFTARTGSPELSIYDVSLNKQNPLSAYHVYYSYNFNKDNG